MKDPDNVYKVGTRSNSNSLYCMACSLSYALTGNGTWPHLSCSFFVCLFLLVCPLTCSQALFLGLCQLPKHLIMNVLGMRPSEEGGGGTYVPA